MWRLLAGSPGSVPLRQPGDSCMPTGHGQAKIRESCICSSASSLLRLQEIVTWSLGILIPGLMTWLMTYPVTISPYFSPRSLKPTPNRPKSPSTPGPAAGHSRLDLGIMAPSVQRYFQSCLAPSTQRTYAGALRRFHSFCTHINVYDPFPVSELLLCSFAAYLADQGLSPQSIKTYLAAVRSVQISLGLPDPRDQSSLPILKRVQAGISWCRLYRKQPTKVRLPLTSEVLLRIQHAPALVSHSNRPVVWAVAAVAFFGFFKLGELLPAARASFHEETDLSWGDVAVDSHDTPQMVKVHLKKSKCDQFGKGVDIYLGRTDTVLCPVKALLTYIEWLILTYIEWRGSQPGPFLLDSSKASHGL